MLDTGAPETHRDDCGCDQDQGRAGAVPRTSRRWPRSCPAARAVAEARKAAIGAFAALGLPHRRIEEWKYTDLRAALKEALPPAVGDAAPGDARSEIDARARSARRARCPPRRVRRRRCTRRAFGRCRRRGPRGRSRWRRRCSGPASRRRRPDPRGRARPGGGDRAQHRVHDRRRRCRASPRAPSWPSRCCSCSSAPARKAALVTTRNIVKLGGRRAGHHHRGARGAAGRRAPARPTR